MAQPGDGGATADQAGTGAFSAFHKETCGLAAFQKGAVDPSLLHAGAGSGRSTQLTKSRVINAAGLVRSTDPAGMALKVAENGVAKPVNVKNPKGLTGSPIVSAVATAARVKLPAETGSRTEKVAETPVSNTLSTSAAPLVRNVSAIHVSANAPADSSALNVTPLACPVRTKLPAEAVSVAL